MCQNLVNLADMKTHTHTQCGGWMRLPVRQERDSYFDCVRQKPAHDSVANQLHEAPHWKLTHARTHTHRVLDTEF